MAKQRAKSKEQRANPPIPPFLKGGEGGLLNEKGIALVMVLVLSAIILVIMAGLIYMLTTGTQLSGMQKRYKTALEAGTGGADVIYQMIAARGNPNIPLSNFLITASNVGGVDCLTPKLNSPTNSWPAACNNSLSIDPNTQSSYDMQFDIGTGPTYRVFAKIVDTVEGNSGGDEGLIKGGVVHSSGEINVASIPFLYTIEVDAQNQANPAERAKLSILYQY
jgi:hypothetical protein